MQAHPCSERRTRTHFWVCRLRTPKWLVAASITTMGQTTQTIEAQWNLAPTLIITQVLLIYIIHRLRLQHMPSPPSSSSSPSPSRYRTCSCPSSQWNTLAPWEISSATSLFQSRLRIAGEIHWRKARTTALVRTLMRQARLQQIISIIILEDGTIRQAPTKWSNPTSHTALWESTTTMRHSICSSRLGVVAMDKPKSWWKTICG